MNRYHKNRDIRQKKGLPNMTDKPMRVLHIFSGMNRGGAETMMMNLYRKMDRTKVQFDF